MIRDLKDGCRQMTEGNVKEGILKQIQECRYENLQGIQGLVPNVQLKIFYQATACSIVLEAKGHEKFGDLARKIK